MCLQLPCLQAPVLTILLFALSFLVLDRTVQTQLLCPMQLQTKPASPSQPAAPQNDLFWSSRNVFLRRHLCLPKTNNINNGGDEDRNLLNDDENDEEEGDNEDEDEDETEDADTEEDETEDEDSEEEEEETEESTETDNNPKSEQLKNPTNQLANFQYIRQPNPYQWESGLKRGSNNHQIYRRFQSDQQSGQVRSDAQWSDPRQIGRNLIVWQ